MLNFEKASKIIEGNSQNSNLEIHKKQQQKTNRKLNCIRYDLANQVLQIMYVDLESEIVKPLAYFAHHGLNGDELRIILDNGLKLFYEQSKIHKELPLIKIIFCAFDGLQ